MVTLIFKSVQEPTPDGEPLVDKMRRILEAHVKEARRAEGQDAADKRLQQFGNPAHRRPET